MEPPRLDRITLTRAILLLAITTFATAQAATTAERIAHLEWISTALPEVPAWNAWQKATGELPPDFDALPRNNFLPDPLQFFDGRPVITSEDWQRRRDEILDAYQHYLLGRLPPKPGLDRVTDGGGSRGDGYWTQSVGLEFGPGKGASVRVQVTLPEGPGPFPAVITPSLGGWVDHLVPRGYAAVGFAGNDFTDDTAVLADLYSDFDFAALPRRAWVVQMVVDYLQTLPEIDDSRIALYGYSRDGKMATIAAALDERIAALIAGSTGVGGVLPWRLAGEWGMGESIESTMEMFPSWFHPRMRFFAGHEDRLPVDANLLVAAIAPRACLIQYGRNDEVSNGWALEQCYESALHVYERLRHPERLSLLREPGFHGSIDPQKCLDWLDIQFGRVSGRTWDNERVFEWDFEPWRARHAAHFNVKKYPLHEADASLLDEGGTSISTIESWEAKAARVRRSVVDLLGAPPPQPPAPSSPFRRSTSLPGPTNAEGSGPGQFEPNVPAWVIGRGIAEFGWLDETPKPLIRSASPSGRD